MCGGEEEPEMNVLVPSEWNITIKKTQEDSDKYVLTYREVCSRLETMSPEDFAKAVENTVKLLHELTEKFGVKSEYSVGSDGFEVELTVTDRLEKIANTIVSEFLPFSTLGNMSIGQIFLNIMYRSVTEEAK